MEIWSSADGPARCHVGNGAVVFRLGTELASDIDDDDRNGRRSCLGHRRSARATGAYVAAWSAAGTGLGTRSPLLRVHVSVRSPDEVIDIEGLFARVRYPDARGEDELAASDRERRRQRFGDPVCGRPCIVGIGFDHQEELVTAEPGNDVLTADGSGQPHGCLHENEIAAVVAEGVVDPP